MRKISSFSRQLISHLSCDPLEGTDGSTPNQHRGETPPMCERVNGLKHAKQSLSPLFCTRCSIMVTLALILCPPLFIHSCFLIRRSGRFGHRRALLSNFLFEREAVENKKRTMGPIGVLGLFWSRSLFLKGL